MFVSLNRCRAYLFLGRISKGYVSQHTTYAQVQRVRAEHVLQRTSLGHHQH